MKVTRNVARQALVLDQIRNSFWKDAVERNKVIHLTDVLKPRQAYWQRVLPIPATDAECLYFLAGRGHEDALGRVAGLLVVTDQKVCNGISYRPDFTMYDVPTEFKTRRANLPAPGEELVVFENYLEQLRSYCAQESSTAAVLIVLSLLEGRSHDPLKPTAPELAVYDVEFTPEELEAESTLLVERRDGLLLALAQAEQSENAVLSGAHASLPLCKDWQCGKPTKIVDKLAYCRACQKEINHKPVHEHVKGGAVDPEVIRWQYTPRCKWYHLCRPQDIDPQRGPHA